jgi:ABC-type sulfate transport system substrate-binding protein
MGNVCRNTPIKKNSFSNYSLSLNSWPSEGYFLQSSLDISMELYLQTQIKYVKDWENFPDSEKSIKQLIKQ